MSKPEIKGSQIRTEPIFKPHHLRHIFSGTIVFLAGIVVDQTLHYYQSRAPVAVHWVNGYRQTNFSPILALPTNAVFSVDFGISDDGRVVWKARL